jgi:predicted transcriptional regulator
MKKEEIVLFLQGKVDDPMKISNEIIKNLLAQNLIAIAPVGNSTYAVTQKGIRAAKV